MTTINQLASVDTLSTSDQLLLYNTTNGDERKASLQALLNFVNSNNPLNPDNNTPIVTTDNGILNAKKFLVADGLTDNTVAFQSLINFACETGRKIYLPAGIYLVNNPIVYPKPFCIEGDFLSTSVIKYNNANGDLFSASSTCPQMKGMKFKDLTFQGIGYNNTGNACAFRGRTVAYLGSASNRNIYFENVSFIGWYATPLQISDSFNCKFIDCNAIDCGNITASSGGTLDSGWVRFHDITFGDVSTTGNIFINCYIANCNKGVYSDYDPMNPSKHQQLGTLFQKCIFENNNYGFDSQRCRDVVFDDCYWEGQLIKGARGGNVTLRNCQQRFMNGVDGFGIQDPDNFFQQGVDGVLVTGTLIYESGSFTKIINYETPQRTVLDIEHGEVTIPNGVGGTTVQLRQYVNDATFKTGAIRLGAFGDCRVYKGTGSPEGVVTASPPSIYFNDGLSSIANSVYIKVTGTNSNTGWISLYSASNSSYTLGTTAQRPSTPTVGAVHSNTSYGNTETWDGARWRNTGVGVTNVIQASNNGGSTLPYKVLLTYNTTETTVGTYTLTTPNSPDTGDVFEFITAGTISTLNWVAGTGGATLVNAPASLNAGRHVKAVFNSSLNKWYFAI